MSIKEKWASLFIPKHSPYCHHSFEPNKKLSKIDSLAVSAKPCKYLKWKYNKEYDCHMEYCKYLKDFLSIQDQVKDCGINDDWDE